MFKSKIDKMKEPEHYYMPTGDGTEPDFAYNKDGELELVGSIYVYDRIQADILSGDINVLIQRFKNGETDVFNQKNGFYADVTEFPSSLMEAKERYDEAIEMYMALPSDIMKKFDSAEDFYMSYGSESWIEKIEPMFESEVKEDEPGNNE